MMRYLFLLVIICGRAWACSCGTFPSAKEAWLDSPLVFIGSIDKTVPKIKNEYDPFIQQTAWVRVTEPFKGVKLDQVLELHGRQSSCFAGYLDGAKLLFYLYPGEKPGTWVVPACHRSRSISDAADDLKFLRGLPASAAGNRVSGTVELWEDDPAKGFNRIRALEGVRVRATGASSSHETFTDAQGVYEFRDLPPGTYTIKIDCPEKMRLRFPIAYGRTPPQRRGRTNTDDNTQLDVTTVSGNGFAFNLAPDTRISGRVLDPDGQPMQGVCIDLDSLQVRSAQRSSIFSCTKVDGAYALEMMPEGRYRLVVNREGVMTTAAPFGRLYYPGTPQVENAGILTVVAGRHLERIDFQAPRLARRIELRGRLTFSDEVPLAGQWLEFRSNDRRYLESGRTDRNGNFVMRILADRPGKLTAEIALWRAQENKCPHFKAQFNPNGQADSLKSTPYPVKGNAALSGINVVFPFPSCDAWIKHQAELNKD